MSASPLPPVKILATDRAKNFGAKIAEGLEKAMNFITGQTDIKVGPFDAFLMPIETYLSVYKKKSVMLKFYVEKAFEGECYWFFEFKTAVALGAFIRLQTESAIAEKIKQENLEKEDHDSFGEVGNQLCGVLDREFRLLTMKKLHLRLDFGKKVYPDEDVRPEHFKTDQEYVVLLSSMTMPKVGAQKLTLLIPRQLYEVMLSMELELDGITPKITILYSPDSDFCADAQLKLNNRHGKVLVAKEPEEILAMCKKQGVVGAAVELPAMAVPFGHKETIFLKRFAANDTLMNKLPCILSMAEAGPAHIQKLHELGIKVATQESIRTRFLEWSKPLLKP